MVSHMSDFDPVTRTAEHLERLKDSHEVLHARQDKFEDILVQLLEKMTTLEAKLDEKLPLKSKVKD